MWERWTHEPAGVTLQVFRVCFTFPSYIVIICWTKLGSDEKDEKNTSYPLHLTAQSSNIWGVLALSSVEC